MAASFTWATTEKSKDPVSITKVSPTAAMRK